MASEKLATLLQEVQQCVDFLQSCQSDSQDLATHNSPSEFWLEGVALNFGKLATDLRAWLSHAKSRRNERNEDQFVQEVEEHSKRCSYMLALLRRAWDEMQPIFTESTLDLAVRQQIEEEVREDISSVRIQIDTLKSLSNFFEKGPPLPFDPKHSLGDVDLRTLFASRIQQMTPKKRQKSFSVLHRGCVDFHLLDLFWDCVLRPEGMPRTTDRSKTFDGILIKPEHVAKARNALQQFRDAWLDENPEGTETHPKDPESLDAITSMPIIACVLHACGRRDLFNDFVAMNIKDSTLDRSPEAFLFDLEKAFKINKRDIDPHEVFAQFSRAKQRHWPDATKLSLIWCEPLPLIEVRPLRQRSNAPALGVYEVRDAWNPSQHYALKVLKPGTATKRQKDELMNEIDQLLELGKKDHGHHFVRCVKTYERANGEEIGMLMTPVADGDLNMMMIRCCTDATFREQHRSELTRACACLAYSLEYLHDVADLRHRDVKPHNVLYLRPDSKSPAEFFWADFGLATVFRDQCFSGTENPGFGATPEYEAPEVDPEKKGIHTRAIDIFSLGCIYLEIVCVLAMKKDQRKDTMEIRSLYWHNNSFYKHHLTGLATDMNKWEKILTTNKDKQALAILKLARRMVLKKAGDRPKIAEVTEELYGSHPQLFCTKCQAKIKMNKSISPKQATNFTPSPKRKRALPLRLPRKT